MLRTGNLFAAAGVAVAALALQSLVVAQGGELAAARLNHIGVVVPDIDVAVREYTRVMGFSTPKVNTYPLPLPDGKTAQVKVTTLTMPNFAIEVQQPVTQSGPYQDHLQRHGPSIQHLGMVVAGPGSIDGVRAALEQKGGVWTLGPKGGNYAYVNFDGALGTTIEVNRGGPGPGEAPPAVPPGDALPALAALNVGHVGFASTDTAAQTAAYARVFGVAAPKVMEYKDAQYPPSAKWSPTAFLRLAFWNQGGIGLEAIESVGGPTPWSEDVAKHKGTIAQHLAINVGNRMDETIAALMAKGGKWTNGKPGGGYAYLDFSDTLGLIFELNGTSKSAPPAK